MFEELLSFQTHLTPTHGRILISEPHLQEEPFQRSVIYLCEHNSQESLGYVLNKQLSIELNDLIPALKGISFPVYIGGPVGTNALHFLHRVPELIGGELIQSDIYWNGDIDKLFDHISSGRINPSHCKIFLGYSGWGEGQLADEIERQSWLVAHSNPELIFDMDEKDIWKQAILQLDKKFHSILNMPLSPEWN